jgi:nitrite reductase/ring-hydroxylating ferredoxin subunit
MSSSPPTTLASADLPEGGMHVIKYGAREIVVCRTKDGVYAVDNNCSHADARLSEGRLRGNRLVCPLHGGAFDVRDGRAVGAPAKIALPTYTVRLVEDRIEIEAKTPADT